MRVFRILIIAFAFVGIIVGAAFATGRESLQFYTSFGMKGTYGVIIATFFYAYCGMMLVRIGQNLKTTNHRDAIFTIGGKQIGRIIDYVIIFTMISVGIGMLAGGGALLKQQYGLPYWVGNLAMTLLVTITIMLRIRKVVIAIGFLTPVLISILIAVCIYSLVSMEGTFAGLEAKVLATQATLPDSLPNWFIAAINHASFNIAVGAGMALVMGGDESFEKNAIWGGLLGGLFVGAILMLGHLALFAKVDSITTMVNGKLEVAEMPLLMIAHELSPFLTTLMTLIVFGMIYNTAVSMFYVFSARFVEMDTPQSKRFILITMGISFVASFVGFTKVVGYFYPLIGYVGIILMGMIFYAPFKLRKIRAEKQKQADRENEGVDRIINNADGDIVIKNIL